MVLQRPLNNQTRKMQLGQTFLKDFVYKAIQIKIL